MFDVKGEVIHNGIKHSRSWNDSNPATVYSVVSPRLTEESPERLSILGDSSFAVT